MKTPKVFKVVWVENHKRSMIYRYIDINPANYHDPEWGALTPDGEEFIRKKDHDKIVEKLEDKIKKLS